MTGKTHAIIGACVGLQLASAAPDLQTAAPVFLLAILGALLPDADSPQSMINKYIPPLALLSLVGHRGILHSLIVPFLLAFLAHIFQAPAPFVTAALLGYLSHLAADALTIRGIPALYPLQSPVRLSPIPIRTGGLIELILASCAVIFFVVQCCTVYNNVQQFLSF